VIFSFGLNDDRPLILSFIDLICLVACLNTWLTSSGHSFENEKFHSCYIDMHILDMSADDFNLISCYSIPETRNAWETIYPLYNSMFLKWCIFNVFKTSFQNDKIKISQSFPRIFFVIYSVQEGTSIAYIWEPMPKARGIQKSPP